MLKTTLRSLCLAALGLAVSTSTFAADEIVEKASPHSVTKTLDRLQAILTKKGITVFARIDHAEGAKKVGLTLSDNQVLIFGNPKLGTPVMKAEPRVGLDLPMKVQAFADAEGKVWVRYARPAAMAARHGGTGPAKIITKMTGALDKLTDAATAR